MKTSKRINSIKILFSCLLLSACMQTTSVMSRSDGMPEWVSGEPDMYPNFKYLSATGSASKAETAKDRALSSLAKIFEVRVREVSTTRENIESHREGGEETVSKNQRLTSMVNLHTDKMIEGARIAEQWQNPGDLTYHALAVLDRTQAGNNIRQEMRRLDEETEFVLQQSAGRNNPLLKIADLNTANQLQADRQVLQKTLKIIDVKGQGSPSKWNLAELEERLDRALRQLPLKTVVSEDSVGGLDRILQGAASQAGFSPGNSGYQLSASMITQPPLQRDGWYWLRGTLKLSLRSDDGQTVLGYKSWPLKVSAQDQGQLGSRMQKAMEKKLKQELFNSVLAFVGN